MRDTVESHETRVVTLNRQLADKCVEALDRNKEMAELKEQLSSLQGELGQLRGQEGQLADKCVEALERSKEMAGLKEQLSSLQGELGQLRGQEGQLVPQLEALKDKASCEQNYNWLMYMYSMYHMQDCPTCTVTIADKSP